MIFYSVCSVYIVDYVNAFSYIKPTLHPWDEAYLIVVNDGFEKKLKLHLCWRDGSVVKSTDCSSRGPEFNSQQSHGGSQPSAMGSNALFWCVCGWLQWTHKKINL